MEDSKRRQDPSNVQTDFPIFVTNFTTGTLAVVEKDSCGCLFQKCIKCDPPPPKEKGCPANGLPLHCYDYAITGTIKEGDDCPDFACIFSPPLAPNNQASNLKRVETFKGHLGAFQKAEVQ